VAVFLQEFVVLLASPEPFAFAFEFLGSDERRIKFGSKRGNAAD
jgi:hypothetical protein